MTTTTPPLNQQDKKMIVLPAIAQPETAITLENRSVQAYRCTWKVENFSRLRRKSYSPIFVVGGNKWRVLIFSKGNNVDSLSMYLDVADASLLPYKWTRYVRFSMAVVNQIQTKWTIRRDTQHHFNARESDWGYTSFMPLDELHDLTGGFLVNDTCIIEVDLAVYGVDENWKHESKKETGHDGINDQGVKLGDCPDHIPEPNTSPNLEQSPINCPASPAKGANSDHITEPHNSIFLSPPPIEAGNVSSTETFTATPPGEGMGDIGAAALRHEPHLTSPVGIQTSEAEFGKAASELAEFDGVDLAAEKSSILATLKEHNPTCLESLYFKTPLMRQSAYDLLAQLLVDLKSLGKDSAPSSYAALLPVLLDLEVCGFQLADLKAYIQLLHQTAEERLNVIAKREAAEKAREELLARLKSLDEEIAGTSLPTPPTSFPF